MVLIRNKVKITRRWSGQQGREKSWT